MMNRIVMLDDITINKIAAGEVVERPASVIKELVENAIDASATRITVEVAEGGRDYIRISDDGDGIFPEDIPLAFQRHSTSKLKTIDDIDRLFSNGFRGEALASIASVSKIEMLTNTDDSGLGKKVQVLDGKIKSMQDVGTKKGTIIKVSELFYNTPARKKFLKSNATESAQISDILSRLAIINSSVAIKYISNGRELFSTVGDSRMLSAISEIYGKTISTNLIPVTHQNNVLKIEGFISNSSLYQSNRKKENIFINKRYIRSTPLNYVVENIYKDLIPIGKYPVFFLDITIDPQFVDPNVHPSKLEVKIANELDVSGPLTDIIRGQLFRSSDHLIPKATIKTYRDLDEEKRTYPNEFVAEAVRITEDPEIQNLDQNKFVYKEFQILSGEDSDRVEVVHHVEMPDIDKNKDAFPTYFDGVVPTGAKLSEDPSEDRWKMEVSQETFLPQDPVLDYNLFEIIGIALRTYIIVTRGTSIYMIDQHAAHERVLYEDFLKKLDLENKDRSFPAQEMIVADIREYATFEYDKIMENKDLFRRLGFDLDDFGFNRIAIRSYPLLFEKEQGMDLFSDMVDWILEGKKIELNSSFNDKIAKMACRKAIKANQAIGKDEIKLLFARLNECNNKYTCPHGRPIFVEWTNHQIEKMFKRIV